MEIILDEWKSIIGFFGVITLFLTTIGYKTKRAKITSVGESFASTINKLSSKDDTERISAAILLRRFFDPKTEMGIGSTPYAKEAVNVIAGTLRTLPVNNFQKILADSLAYAPDLIGIDLQKTNLQDAYLGVQKKQSKRINLSKGDFYKSDLSRASFKGAILNHAVFYQARLLGTVFRDADLRYANFYEANILGAKFNNAKLEGAAFNFARNIPEDILKHLDCNGIYKTNISSNKDLGIYVPKEKLKIFISKSNALSLEQETRYENLLEILQERGKIETLERTEYQPFGALSTISTQIKGCSGLVIIGFEQLKIKDGDFRSLTNEHKELCDISLATPWNHIEAGMAAMMGIPILILADNGINDGIFEDVLDDSLLFRTTFSKQIETKELRKKIDEWYDAIK